MGSSFNKGAAAGGASTGNLHNYAKDDKITQKKL